MLSRLFYCGAAVLTGLVLATQPALAEAPARESIPAQGIIASLSLDFNNDTRSDQVLLVRDLPDNADTVNLVIVLGAEVGEVAGTVFAYPRATWAGSMAGQEPKLTAENEALLVTSQNDSIGRGRWREQLRILFRNDKPVLAGYTYASWDTLDLDAFSECDINLLTGKRILNKKTSKLARPLPVLESWTNESGTTLCADTNNDTNN